MFKSTKAFLLAIALSIAYSPVVFAQTAGESIDGFRLAQGSTYNGFTCPSSSLTPCFVQYGSTIPVSGTFSASLAGFNATAGATANLTDLVNTSQDVALPAGADVAITNKGSVAINFRMQTGAGVAVSTDQTLVPGATAGIHITAQTHISAIAPTGTGTGATAGQLNIQGGTGLVTGYGGGSSASSGSGGNVTIVGPLGQAAMAASLPVVIASNQSNVPVSQATASSLNAQVQGPQAAGASNTGNPLLVAGTAAGASGGAINTLAVDSSGRIPVNIAQWAGNTINTGNGTSTTAARVTISNDSTGQVTLAAGAALVGKVGIDQTTPGTTNAVSLSQIGAVTISSGTGAVGTGSPRVAVGTDTATIAGSAPGTAGTPSAQVVSIQGVASGTVVPVSSGVAQGSTTSGQTVSPIGCRTLSATPTDTTAQTNMPVCTLQGALISSLYALPDDMVSGTTAAMTGTTSTSLIAAPAGSLHNYITQIACVNSHATVGTFVTVQDGSGGTALATLAAAAVFGGETVTFPTPLRQPTAATALFVADVTTGANVICSATGYKAL